MALWFAFLRGINLGNRQVKMAALKTCLEAADFAAVKTVLASGNVRFEATGTAEAIKNRMEAAIEKQFGFAVGVILRDEKSMRDMLDKHPFAALDPKADVTRHVALFGDALPRDLTLDSKPGHTEILRVDPREIYIAGYRQPNGRYTEGVDEVMKPLDKKLSVTMRNWNTMEKMLP
ncbi:MAG: DUF1697 domain-containing protein [Candidatus Devosia phytovorans]|uniref:DUF1697 domain-containing protein n=1 Tax=Candidatus Devosia phytovorans TaxID=3121372 RepID=A0AAJ6B0X9_9HYPH|nr:DUF1697 domain-containing protein [Devosia sp.]WEK03968.1 MAG: DUF1697 domain-containing protein [Devosia sp.]